MALIKFGMMMTDARGKLGGQVFTKTRSGATVRTKVTPTNPQTQAQQQARSILGGLSAGWRNLSEEARRGWNAAAKDFSKTNIFGDAYNPSGKNLYVGLNANLLSAAVPSNDQVPVSVEIPPYILDSIVISLLDSEINIETLSPWPVGDFAIVYQATRPMSAGRFNFSGQYATFQVGKGAVPPTNKSLYTNYVGKFGALPPGTKISFRVFVISTASGQKSVESTADSIVE